MRRIDELKEEIKKLADNQYKNTTFTGSIDVEENHRYADRILCAILEELGYSEVVENFNRILKWYS